MFNKKKNGYEKPNCLNCDHYAICFIRRDIGDVITSAPVQFREDDQTNKELFNGVYAALSSRCREYKPNM